MNRDEAHLSGMPNEEDENGQREVRQDGQTEQRDQSG